MAGGGLFCHCARLTCGVLPGSRGSWACLAFLLFAAAADVQAHHPLSGRLGSLLRWWCGRVHCHTTWDTKRREGGGDVNVNKQKKMEMIKFNMRKVVVVVVVCVCVCFLAAGRVWLICRESPDQAGRMTHTLDEIHLLWCQRAAQMLICSVFNALEREQVRDSVSPVNGTTVYSPLLYSGSAGMGKSCILCCSSRRRLSSSSCWATLVTASNWCSLSSFLRQAKNHTVKVVILRWVLSL